MLELSANLQRRTTTDSVFDQLYEDIATLRLLPGAKLSETEIAQRFGVSRQPVRDAFNRLENLDLLRIRPQRATKVRGFSLQIVANARFVRLAVELEVIRYACSIWDEARASKLANSIEEQHQSLVDGDAEQFHRLDYHFHKLICELADHPVAFNTIEECKQKVDRLCVLSLDRQDEFSVLFDDHCQLADAIKGGSPENATKVARRHLARLDKTIEDIHLSHSHYFE